MEVEALVDKLSKAISLFLEKESYDTLNGRVGTHFFEDNNNVQWVSESKFFQIEFEVIDEWGDEKKTIFVVADATDGFQRIGAELLFPETGKGILSKPIYKYDKGVPTEILS